MKDIDKAGMDIIKWTEEDIQNGIFCAEQLVMSLVGALNKHDLAELKEHLEKYVGWEKE